eukprot:UN24781
MRQRTNWKLTLHKCSEQVISQLISPTASRVRFS